MTSATCPLLHRRPPTEQRAVTRRYQGGPPPQNPGVMFEDAEILKRVSSNSSVPM